ncbi:MAG TPA: radical SAM protein [Solirubrobacteraceae bacterium]|jgi:uncharacterized protein|nr:radical SAM protein [Solirubrobacteraceae bacterium]
MVEWVVEASTFCNLRCAYCYQWDGLADQRRMPLDLWRRVLRAACDYHVREEERRGEPVSTRVIWHGGEPLALPLPYLERTFALKEEAVAAARIPPERMTTAMQTNLYAVSDAAIELLRRHEVGFGVSFDVVRGVRMTAAGRPSEDRVLTNLDRLRDAGLSCGAITVLAGHTCGMVRDVFDFWAARGMSFRVLPLFDGPPSRDAARFAAGEDELVGALCRLFDHWMRSDADIAVAPLDEWLANVARSLAGEAPRVYDRRREGESVLVVRPDGRLFQVAEVGDDALALGDLATQTMEEVLAGDAYAASLARSEALTRRRCTGCRFERGCDRWPAHSAPVAPPPHGRCQVAYRVQAYMERYLRRAGLDAAALSRPEALAHA